MPQTQGDCLSNAACVDRELESHQKSLKEAPEKEINLLLYLFSFKKSAEYNM